MKKLLLLALFSVCLFSLKAQLPDGSIAPNFTAYEIDKNTGTIISDNPYRLYDYLDDGKVVYIDFFGTWCGPCWNYHNTGAFETLYNQYGPEGTDEIMAFAIETGDGTAADLAGTGSNTWGNWLNGVLYPVIPTGISPNTQAVVNNYSITAVPTIYMVCPSRLLYEVGQLGADGLYAAKSICPQYDASVANNAVVLEVKNVSENYYCEMETEPKVKIQNVGSETMTSAVFSITFDGETTSFDWTGNLAQFATAEITLPQISTDQDGAHIYSVELVSVNGVEVTDDSWKTTEFNISIIGEATSEDVAQDFSVEPTSPWFFDDVTYIGLYNGAIYFNGYSSSSGTTASLFTPLMDISRFESPVLKFDVAHQRYSSYSERLMVQSSTNCGTNWSTLYNKAGAALATVSGSATSAFVPTSSQWRTEIVDLSNIADKNNVALRFKFTSGYGNLVWLDNIVVTEGAGVEDNEATELSIYPNPVSDVLYLNASAPIKDVQIFNLQGQLVRAISGDVHEISVADMADGVYMIKVITEAGNVTNQKIVKQ